MGPLILRKQETNLLSKSIHNKTMLKKFLAIIIYKILLCWKINFPQLTIILFLHSMLITSNFQMRKVKKTIKVQIIIILMGITKKN
jgi:hypothetical protein